MPLHRLKLWWVLPAALAFGLALRPVTDYDLGFHLVTGKWELSHGMPLTDPFSFTQLGKPWFHEQFLGDISFYSVYHLVGVSGLIVFKALLLGAAFTLLCFACGGGGLGAAAAMLAAAAAQVRFNTQPFVFSFFFLCVTALWLARGRRLFWLLPLFAVWPHVHVGYFYGTAFVGLWSIGLAAEQRSPRPLLLPAACGATAIASLLLLHPQGLGVLERVWHIYRSDFYRANIIEMQPLGQSYPINAPVVLLFLAPPLVALWTRKVPLRWLVPQMFFAFSAARVGRLVSEASIIAAPAFALSLIAVAERLQQHTARLQKLGAPALAVAAALAVGGHLAQVPKLGWLDFNYPRACYDWIDAHEPGRGFNDMMFGGTLMFHFWPKRLVFIDGRPNYPEQFWLDDYYPVKNAAPGWKDVAKKWDLRWFLLHPARFALLHRALQSDKDFRLAHSEPNCTVYERVR